MRKGRNARLENLPVTVRLGRFDGGSTNGGFHLELRDERSGMHIADLELPLSAAADLFTQREVRAVAEYLSDHENIGLWHEARRIRVPIPEELASGWTDAGRAKLMEYLAKNAVMMAHMSWGGDWHADRESFNHHRVSGNRPRLYEVWVRRWTATEPRDRAADLVDMSVDEIEGGNAGGVV